MGIEELSVCMIAAEAYPYSKVGGLGDVVSALSAALIEEGVKVRVLTPLYPQVSNFPTENQGEFKRIRIGDRDYKGALYVDTSQSPSVNYFIASEEFFDRSGIYDNAETGEGYSDNFERFNFFTLACLQILTQMKWRPDVVHCHDWHTALIPAHLKFRKKTHLPQDTYDAGTLFTIHNLAYQGICEPEKFDLTDLPADLFCPDSPFEHFGNLNPMKAGIAYAGVINSVSPEYAREIQTKELGCGLEGVLRERRSDLYGILNGIDTRVWDPQSDPLIFANYSADDFSNKKVNKKRLQKLCRLAERNVPLIGIISRLADQKGIDLFLAISDELSRMDCQWVILGTGSRSYEDTLGERERHPH